MGELRFAAWMQTSIGAAIDHEDTGGRLGDATFTPKATLLGPKDERKDVARAKPLLMLGPGGAAGIDPRVVGRAFPAAGSADARTNDLVAVELTVEELPWLLTPARPGGNRLRPWIVLVVVDAATPFDPTTRPLPVLRANPRELPNLAESWAWAHVQRGGAGDNGIARLLCPRRLDEHTRYRACVVPAFEGGRQAGLGASGPATESRDPAWSITSGDDVSLPVYYWWEFGTGAEGDFEDLVRRLGPAGATSGLGAVDVDASQPWPAPSKPLAGTNGVARLPVDGAMRPIRAAAADPQPDPLPIEAVTDFRDRLSNELAAPARRLAGEHDPDDKTGAVAPPIYGGRHVGVDRVEASPELPLADLGWVTELNLDPANRIAAGLATDYIRANQEDLMARAWEQVGAIREANRRLHLAELATDVTASVHRRHVKTLRPGELLGFAAPAAARTRMNEPTLAMHVAASPLPDAAASSSFARLMRPTGFVARRTASRMDSIVTRGFRGQVTVPDPQPIVAADLQEPEPGTPAPFTTLYAAERIVRLDAVRRVADANALSSAAGMVGQPLDSIEGLDMAAVATADVPAVETSVSSQLGGVFEAMRTIAGSDFSGQPADDGRVVSPVGVQLDAGQVTEGLVQALDPGDRILRRLASRIGGPGAPEGGPEQPLMAYPTFPAPVSLALLATSPEWFLPGLGAFSAESVALLEANASFIESYMVGLNHELMSELLWREYPTDRRGSPFCHFWPRPDFGDDVPPIHTWDPGSALGTHDALSASELAVLLVRGEVVRRFPDMIVTAVKGIQPDLVPGASPLLSPNPADVRQALFVIPIDASTAAYAFAVPRDELGPPHRPGWFFVFQEHDYRMRFGFDLPPDPPSDSFATFDQLDWHHVDLGKRGFASVGADLRPSGANDGLSWGPGSDSVNIARIALQKPFRVAMHADLLVKPAEG
jgi:hypothetical protein